MPDDDFWRALSMSAAPTHRVTLSRPFYLGVVEVTQEQFYKVLGRSPSQSFSTEPGADDAGARTWPVNSISFYDAVEFCDRLSERERLAPIASKQGGASTSSDPRGSDEGASRVLRGGHWQDSSAACRSAFRNALDPSLRRVEFGFRVAVGIGAAHYGR